LVVTSVLARVTSNAATVHEPREIPQRRSEATPASAVSVPENVLSRLDPQLSQRIGDSKALLSFANNALGEAWARAITTHSAVTPRTPGDLLDALLIDSEAHLTQLCPSHHVDLCWGQSHESFAPGSDDLTEQCLRDIDDLERAGVFVQTARSIVICTKRLNMHAEAGTSRFDVDLHAMERLALQAREQTHEEIVAVCGKVGGYQFYGPHFGPLASREHQAVVESRARSEYRVAGLGTLVFLRDADASNPLVSLASLIGKWVRDTFTRRVLAFHTESDNGIAPGQANVSGYHDVRTKAFIEATRLVRARRQVDPHCFERTAASAR